MLKSNVTSSLYGFEMWSLVEWQALVLAVSKAIWRQLQASSLQLLVVLIEHKDSLLLHKSVLISFVF